ncbi:MAG: hypothetical protein Q9166_003234 [cf. Caloplaca sp. 2 TL-2023]
MCNIVVALIGCGHERFLRVALPCPAGFCLEHKQCFADHTRTTRTIRIRAPPYCRECFNEKNKSLTADFVKAMDDLFIHHHQAVRSFYRACYGFRATNEDRDRIIAHIEKNRDASREQLKREFFGPTLQAPHGRLALLYEQPEESFRSHEKCIDAFRVADSWISSEDGSSEASAEYNEGFENPEDTMRQWYGGIQQFDPQTAPSVYCSSSEASESGEYFREHQRRHYEAFSLRRQMETPLDSEVDSNSVHRRREIFGLHNLIEDSTISDFDSASNSGSILLEPEDQLDLNDHGADVSGIAETRVILLPHRYTLNDANVHQTREAMVSSGRERASVRGRSGAQIPDGLAIAVHGPDYQYHTSLAEVREQLRVRLEQLDREFNAQQTPSSSTEDLLEGIHDRVVAAATANTTPRDDHGRQSMFHEHFSESSETGTTENLSPASQLEDEEHAA